jgi:uncharacterized membrane protein (TIGR02234 family)
VIRIAQVLLVVAAGGLWLASRLPWVQIQSFDGLGQPKTVTLNGATWSTALIPLALLLLAAAVAALAVRGWPLRLLSALVAGASAAMGYLALAQWVAGDVAVRAADLVQVPVAQLTGSTERHYWGAIATLLAAGFALSAAVLLMRSAAKVRSNESKYVAPAARREAAQRDDQLGGGMSERMIWDALDEGRDPTDQDNKGR